MVKKKTVAKKKPQLAIDYLNGLLAFMQFAGKDIITYGLLSAQRDMILKYGGVEFIQVPDRKRVVVKQK